MQKGDKKLPYEYLTRRINKTIASLKKPGDSYPNQQQPVTAEDSPSEQEQSSSFRKRRSITNYNGTAIRGSNRRGESLLRVHQGHPSETIDPRTLRPSPLL